jgi:hypothetical protein
MEVVIVGLVALIGGFALGAKLGTKTASPALREMSVTQTIDRANYLQTHRRELANILIWRDPQRYLQLYRHLQSEMVEYHSWRPEEVRSRLTELSKTYPNYSDFDAIGTREYVLYSDAVLWIDKAELEQRYRDIVTFVTLSVISSPAWSEAATRGFVHKLSKDELAHLADYVQRIEDTKLQLRIHDAVDAYYAWRDEQSNLMDNDHYSIRPLDHFAANRLGIHFKRTGEFAIYSYFTFDEGRSSRSYYRSDPTFQQEQRLEVLCSVLEEVIRKL